MSSISFIACSWFETLSQPHHCMFVASPSFRTIADFPSGIEIGRMPCFYEILASEDNGWWNRRSVNTDAFNRSYPFLPSRLCLLSTINGSIDNTLSSFEIADIKPCLVHVIHILGQNVEVSHDAIQFNKPFLQLFSSNSISDSLYFLDPFCTEVLLPFFESVQPSLS